MGLNQFSILEIEQVLLIKVQIQPRSSDLSHSTYKSFSFHKQPTTTCKQCYKLEFFMLGCRSVELQSSRTNLRSCGQPDKRKAPDWIFAFNSAYTSSDPGFEPMSNIPIPSTRNEKTNTHNFALGVDVSSNTCFYQRIGFSPQRRIISVPISCQNDE